MIEALQSDSKRIDPTTIELRITIPAAELSNRYQAQLQETAVSVNLPGFRPGKIPMSIVKAKFGEALLADLAQNLIQEAFPQSLQETKIDPVATAEIEDVVYGEGKDVSFTAKIPVAPEFEVKDFEGLTSWKYAIEIAESDIDESLTELRKRFATHPAIDLPATENNFLACEVTQLDNDGYPLRDSIRKFDALPIATDPLGAGSTAQLVGAVAGETRKVVTTAQVEHEDHHHEHTYFFKVKIDKVVDEIIPELDDEFAKQFGRFQNLQELRDAIRDELKENATHRSEEGLLVRLRDAVIASNDIEVPEPLVTLVAQRMQQELEERSPVSEELVEKILKPAAKQSAKWELIAERITQQLSIIPTDEEIEREIQMFARKNRVPVADVKERFEDPVRRRSLKIGIAEQKALTAIREKAQVEEKPIGFAEFGKLQEV